MPKAPATPPAPEISSVEAYALRAVATGTATPEQQRQAFEVIANRICIHYRGLRQLLIFHPLDNCARLGAGSAEGVVQGATSQGLVAGEFLLQERLDRSEILTRCFHFGSCMNFRFDCSMLIFIIDYSP